jgi:hypothetical protein
MTCSGCEVERCTNPQTGGTIRKLVNNVTCTCETCYLRHQDQQANGCTRGARRRRSSRRTLGVAGPPRASSAGDASGVGLLALDRGLDGSELLLKSESPRESGPGPNAGGGAPSESGGTGKSSPSSGVDSSSPGLKARPKRGGMGLVAVRDVSGNSHSFQMMSRETMIPPRLPCARGPHSFQPLKSSSKPRNTQGFAWFSRCFRSFL